MSTVKFPRKIIVFWRNDGDDELETIDLDHIMLHGTHANVSTSAVWPLEGRRVQYSASCETDWRRDGSRVLTLSYDSRDNLELKEVPDIWGTSRLIFVPGASSGTAEWCMQNSSRWYKRKWKSLESCLSEPRGRESVERFSRRQQELKARLLRYYNSCAITGEKNTDALEAAHIVSVAGNGADTELNAILLRADIHRLYDRDYFVIDANGQIHTRKPLSAEYKAIFRRKKAIDHAVLSIVKDALALRGDA